MQLLYKGKDIAPKIEINELIIDDDCGDTLDSVKIIIDDAESLWLKFKPQQHDEIEVKQGGYSTGEMYIDTITPDNGKMIITALPIKAVMRTRKTGAWEKSTLQVILQQKAAENNLRYQGIFAVDCKFERVDQQGTSDLLFLKQQCDQRKLKFKIYDRKIVVYSEEEMERKQPVRRFRKEHMRKPKFKMNNMDLWSSLTLSYNGTTIAITDVSVNGCMQKHMGNIPFYSVRDGEQYAKGLLYNNNKNKAVGSFATDLDLGVTAGNAIAIENMGMLDGNYFVSHATHDLINNATTFSVRRVGDI